MIEVYGDLWSFDGVKVITTNGFVKRNGCAVMGRGCARQAASKYPLLPKQLGEVIRHHGNHAWYFDDYSICTLPVKHNWWEQADLALIRRSVEELTFICATPDENIPIYIPRPGCGNGRLVWADVKPVIEPILVGDKYRIVTYRKE